MKRSIPLSLSFLLLCSCQGTSSIVEKSTVDISIKTSFSSEDKEFRVLTWNIYLGKGKGENFVYTIKENDPDIIHLQEAKGAYENFISPLLKDISDYSLINDSIVDDVPVCSTPIIFRKSKFELVDYGAERLKDAYQGNDTKTLSYVVLQEKKSEKLLFDFCFHGAIISNKYDGYQDKTKEECVEISKQMRTKNVQQILDKLDALQTTYGKACEIITGDCNFDSPSDAYGLLMKENFTDSEQSALLYKNTEGLQTSHTMGEYPNQGLSIDHIFGRNGTTFLSQDIIRTQLSLDASDHDPVIADVYLNE